MSTNQYSILLVDDSPEVRIIGKKMLNNFGFEVIEADGNSGAIEAIKRKLPQLIILDLQMTSGSGFDFLTIRQKNEQLKLTPVIVLSGLSDKESIYKAISLGANDYLLKPLKLENITPKLKKYFKNVPFADANSRKPVLGSATVKFEVQIIKIEKASVFIESPISIGELTQFTLNPEKIESIDTSNYVLQTDGKVATKGLTGKFYSRVVLIGLETTLPKLLKKGTNAG